MKIRVTRAFEVERHDVGTDVEPGETDVRHLLLRGRYMVVSRVAGYVWLRNAKDPNRIHYAMRADLYALAVTAGVIIERTGQDE